MKFIALLSITLVFGFVACGARTELDTPTVGSAKDASVDVVVQDHAAQDAEVESPTDVAAEAPNVPDAGAPIPAISAASFACALNASGIVKCWQKYAQAIAVPLPVIVEVAVGGSRAFARAQDDSLWVWGIGQSCDVGDGVAVQDTITKPLHVSALGNSVSSIRASGEQALAVLTDGSVVAFGLGPNGTGKNQMLCTPTPVLGLMGPVVKIALNGNNACALLADHRVQCWGENFFGTSGNGNSDLEDTADSPVTGLGDAVDVAVSYTHACGARAGGAVVCWGDDTVGELGDGQTDASSYVPVDVTGLAGPAVAVTANLNNTCARLASGAVQCWGKDDSGSLGNGGTPSVVLAPTTIVAGDAISLDQTQSFGCVLLSSGVAECWGLWDPQDDAGSPSPLAVLGMP